MYSYNLFIIHDISKKLNAQFTQNLFCTRENERNSRSTYLCTAKKIHALSAFGCVIPIVFTQNIQIFNSSPPLNQTTNSTNPQYSRVFVRYDL